MKTKLHITILLLVISLSLFPVINFKVNAANGIVENEGATYRVTDTIEHFDLGYDIFYQRDNAMTTVKKGHYSGKVAGLGSTGEFEEGKDYHQEVNMLEIAPSSAAQLIPYAYLKNGLWNAITVRGAAEEFEKKNPGYMVIAAVNGDWFQINQDVKASTGVTISNGEYYKATSTHGENANIIIIDNDNKSKRLTDSGVIDVTPVLSIYDDQNNIIKKINIDKINQEPGNNEVSLYYASRQNSNTNYSDNLISINVENAWVVDQAEIAVTAIYGSFYGKGQVNKVDNSYEVKKGKFAIKTNNSEINSLLKNGTTIRCQYEFSDANYKNIKNAISFPYKVMENSKAIYSPNEGKMNDGKTRKPRTMIGQKEDGTIFLAQVDGRQQKANKYGLTQMEMGALFSYYNCVEGWKLDGGGSSTMIIRKQNGVNPYSSFNNRENNDWYVVNSPSDGNERNDGNCLLVVVEIPKASLDIVEITSELIIFQVNLISLIDKYSELAIIANGKEYPVVDGKAVISGLKEKEKLEIYLYGKEDDKYFNLGIRKIMTSALYAPNTLRMELGVVKKGNNNVVELFYLFDKKEAIKKIEIIIDDNKVTTFTQKMYIDFSSELFESLNNIEVNVYISRSEFVDDEVLVFKNVNINYSLDFILNEMKYTNNEILKNIFCE